MFFAMSLNGFDSYLIKTPFVVISDSLHLMVLTWNKHLKANVKSVKTNRDFLQAINTWNIHIIHSAINVIDFMSFLQYNSHAFMTDLMSIYWTTLKRWTAFFAINTAAHTHTANHVNRSEKTVIILSTRFVFLKYGFVI